MVVGLAIEALLYSILSLVPLALEDLIVPDPALVNDLVHAFLASWDRR